MKIKVQKAVLMEMLTECINVRYAYERQTFKHVEPEGGGLSDKDIDKLEEDVRASFSMFFHEQFEFEEE